ISHLYSGKILYYSVNGPADIWAEKMVADERGTHFDVHFRSGESFPVYLPLHGKHNVLNALPAIAIARYFDLTTAEITAALATVSVSGMRFEIIHPPTGEIVVNDAYNAGPSSMEVSLTTYASLFPERKKVLVLADMLELGEESAEMHRAVGEIANGLREHFTLLVAIGERSRHLYEAYQGEKLHFARKEEALPALLPLKTKEYALLFKGSRGIKMETLIKEFLG
ncbi:Mur ligase family protein, partial [Microbacteriaceae bacterium K1510]|nr:Mur ligase family protein [Microbacteriaceae bacterium K1510]